MTDIYSFIITVGGQALFCLRGVEVVEISIEDLEFSSKDKRLNHLSQEDVVELMKSYYAGEKVSGLLKEYEVKISPSQLYAIFPPTMAEEECEYCGSSFVYPWGSKTWGEKVLKNQSFCIDCGHDKTSLCSCEYCKEAREIAREEAKEKQKQLLDRKRKIIHEHFAKKNWQPLDEETLSLEDRLFLAAILRASLSENTDYVEPLESVSRQLAPSEDFEIEIIKTLTARKVLVPHANSSLDVFKLVEDDKIQYEIYHVNYRINIEPYDNDYDAMIKRLMYPDATPFEENKEYCLEMWKKISLNESFQYLLYQMNKVGYSFSPGDKTTRVFEYLLEHFSTSQIYNIIYRAVANSTARYQSGEVTKIHAQNSVITSCEKQGERAIAENWSLKSYGRIKGLPETIISEVFFTSILKVAYLGFLEKPTTNF